MWKSKMILASRPSFGRPNLATWIRWDSIEKHQRFSWHMDVSSNGGNPKSAKIVSPCSMTSSCSFLQGKSWLRRVPAPSSWVPLEVTFSPLLQALRCHFFLGGVVVIFLAMTPLFVTWPPWVRLGLLHGERFVDLTFFWFSAFCHSFLVRFGTSVKETECARLNQQINGQRTKKRDTAVFLTVTSISSIIGTRLNLCKRYGHAHTHTRTYILTMKHDTFHCNVTQYQLK